MSDELLRSPSHGALHAPSGGPAWPRRTVVREKRIGDPSCRTAPIVGCWASQKKSRAASDGSLKTSS